MSSELRTRLEELQARAVAEEQRVAAFDRMLEPMRRRVATAEERVLSLPRARRNARLVFILACLAALGVSFGLSVMRPHVPPPAPPERKYQPLYP